MDSNPTTKCKHGNVAVLCEECAMEDLRVVDPIAYDRDFLIFPVFDEDYGEVIIKRVAIYIDKIEEIADMGEYTIVTVGNRGTGITYKSKWTIEEILGGGPRDGKFIS